MFWLVLRATKIRNHRDICANPGMGSNMQHVFRDSTPPIRRDMNNIWHHFAISKKLNHVADIIKLTKNAIEFHDSSDHAVFMEIFWIQFFDQGIPLGIPRVFLYNVLIPVTTVWGPHTSIKLRMDYFSVLIVYQNQHLKEKEMHPKTHPLPYYS